VPSLPRNVDAPDSLLLLWLLNGPLSSSANPQSEGLIRSPGRVTVSQLGIDSVKTAGFPTSLPHSHWGKAEIITPAAGAAVDRAVAGEEC
jgi:hypothetical protein